MELQTRCFFFFVVVDVITVKLHLKLTAARLPLTNLFAVAKLHGEPHSMVGDLARPSSAQPRPLELLMAAAA